MEKTKIGLSAGILGAIAFLAFLFGGYVPGLLVVGYILLCEKSESLRVSAATALLITLAAAVLNLVIGLIPDLLRYVNSLLNIFDEYMDVDVVYNIENFLTSTVGLVKMVALVGLAVFSFLNKPLQIPFIKKLIAE
jgi:hypothetical protein